MTEDERAGWHHPLNGHEFENFLGDGEGQGSLAHYSPWGHKELDTTDQPNTHTHTHTIILSHVSIFSSVQSLSRV